MPMKIRVATRRGPLAIWQTNYVIELLRERQPDVDAEIVEVTTAGDRQADVPIQEIGGKGVFVSDVQAAVLDSRADVAVHSAKDLQSTTVSGLALAAVLERGDPQDCLVGCRLADLPEGATVATGAPRRRAQLAHMRPDLRFVELRGNIDTRLERLGSFDAIVMAKAALDRLGREPEVVDPLPVEEFVPQVGQGAIAVECRADDELKELLVGIEDQATRRAVDAERAFLAELGGDCQTPAGAYAFLSDTLELTGVLATAAGGVERHTEQGEDPHELGSSVARHLLRIVNE